MAKIYKQGYDQEAVETLDEPGVFVYPAAKEKIKKFLNAMGLTKGQKVKIKVSEIRNLIRDILSEAVCSECTNDKSCDECLMDEQLSTVGRSNFMTASDNSSEEEEAINEFTDWAAGFQEDFDNKRYEQLARQIYDDWPEHGTEVDWANVLDIYIKNRKKNIHTEIDKDRLYEKLLSYAESRYDGMISPTVLNPIRV